MTKRATATSLHQQHTEKTPQTTNAGDDESVDGLDIEQRACFRLSALEDQHEWEELVRTYEPYLKRLAASYRLGDDAHDAVQQTFCQLVQHRHRIRKPESVKFWLATVLRNECLSALARRRRERPVDADHMEGLQPPVDADLGRALLREEGASFVQQALARLPLRQRQVMELLADPENEGYRWLAERLNIPVGSIGPTRQRALARLQDILSEMDYDQAA
jgi:RNA polymerase sigma factor (sigma-70 family)